MGKRPRAQAEKMTSEDRWRDWLVTLIPDPFVLPQFVIIPQLPLDKQTAEATFMALPEIQAIYFVLACEQDETPEFGTVLYIGRTNNLCGRMIGHTHTDGTYQPSLPMQSIFKTALDRHWQLSLTWVQMAHTLPYKPEDLECVLIDRYQPTFNRRYNPTHHPTSTSRLHALDDAQRAFWESTASSIPPESQLKALSDEHDHWRTASE
jgi:hypothetical protein